MHVGFFIHTSTKWKKSTVNSYNIISNHFHAKLKRKQLRNEVKFKFIRKRKNKLTNGHGGVIIQLRAAIFERIGNVQIQALETVFICLLSVPFLCVFPSLIQLLPTSRCLQWHNARFCNVLFDVTSCYRKSLCKMPSAFFSAGIFFIYGAMNIIF